MNIKVLAAVLVCAAVGYSQQTQAPSITVEQIMSRSIEALGGRQALQAMSSVVMTGTTEVLADNVTGETTTYAEAPDRFATVTNFEGYGAVGRGFDGKIGWRTDPQQGTIELTGNALADAKREAQFEGDLRWKELYPKAEVTGTDKVDGRDCWVVKMTPTQGDAVTRYYDAQTFLLARAVAQGSTPQGPGEIVIDFSDYQDIGNGVKLPHTLKINVPGVGDVVLHYATVKYNVAIDSARFSRPAE